MSNCVSAKWCLIFSWRKLWVTGFRLLSCLNLGQEVGYLVEDKTCRKKNTLHICNWDSGLMSMLFQILAARTKKCLRVWRWIGSGSSFLNFRFSLQVYIRNCTRLMKMILCGQEMVPSLQDSLQDYFSRVLGMHLMDLGPRSERGG